MPGPLVVLDQLLDVVGVLEDVQPADAGQSELLGPYARVAYLTHTHTHTRAQVHQRGAEGRVRYVGAEMRDEGGNTAL